MIISILLTILLVFGIPLTAVLFATDAGMAICILSFYLVNPIVSVCIGVFAGYDINKRWYATFSPAIIFIITVWSLFTLSEPIFLYYSVVYLVFSIITMLITSLIRRRKK